MNSFRSSPFAASSSVFGQRLRQILASEKRPEFRAIIRNLLCDHRISDERANDIESIAGGTALKDFLNDYQKDMVRPLRSGPNSPAYMHPSNSVNEVGSSGKTLCTVVDLAGYRWRRTYVEAAKTFGMPDFRSFEYDDADQVKLRLTEKLADLGKRGAFMKSLFAARRQYLRRAEKQRHPVWAADWGSLSPFLDSAKPARWQQAVGVVSKEPSWLAVVKYRLPQKKVPGSKHNARLFRPTQLEAGWYPQHFPSPPRLDPGDGGVTMFLHRDTSAPEDLGTRLVFEYIHEEVEFTFEDWVEGGRLLGQTEDPVPGDLSHQRECHWKLLQKTYSSGQVPEWMPDPS